MALLDSIYQKIFELFIGSGRFSSLVRHALSAAGVYLVQIGLKQEVVDAWVNPTADLLVGLSLIALAYVSSRENKKL